MKKQKLPFKFSVMSVICLCYLLAVVIMWPQHHVYPVDELQTTDIVYAYTNCNNRVSQIADIIRPIAEQHGLKAVYLFGSYARGTATEQSDIDLLIDTTGTSIKSLLGLSAVYCDLEDALHKPIDLITISSLEQISAMISQKHFQENVMAERVNLYAVA